MATSTGTLNGIVYITKADYLTLKNAGSTGAVIGTSTDRQYYDINKVYIIQEEMATVVDAATASGSLSNQPATTNAIWAAILSASGATYSIHNTTFTNGAGISISSPKLGIASSTVGLIAGNYITITQDTTNNTITFSSTDANTTYSISNGTGSTVTLTGNDGTSITRTIDGVLRSASTGKIDVALASTCADYYLFFAGKSGTPDAQSTVSYNTDLKYNPSAKILYATTFQGALTGKATTAETADKVANNLTISLNGAAGVTYDGSAAKSINITPSNIGAAPSSHQHTSTQISDRITTSAGIVNGAVGLPNAHSVYQFVTGQITQIHNFMGDITPATMTSATTASSDGKYYVGTHQLINGDVYNVNSAFVIPGSSSPTYQAGMNIAWVNETHKWDALGGAYTLELSTDTNGSAVQINYGGATSSININNVGHAETATSATYAANISNGATSLTATQIINALTITYLV